ncbi:hypothetical protein [Dokdonia sp.]|uniref:hypothetical protein n=1 Tax=Dokdonia sp. TaxID=2024995 RepID=UPI003266B9EF
MLENIKNLNGVQKINKAEQVHINGGNKINACFFISCRDGLECINGRCVPC